MSVKKATNEIINEVRELQETLRYHAKKYYVYDAPEISDYE